MLVNSHKKYQVKMIALDVPSPEKQGDQQSMHLPEQLRSLEEPDNPGEDNFITQNLSS